jgi:hypothetical protein
VYSGAPNVSVAAPNIVMNDEKSSFVVVERPYWTLRPGPMAPPPLPAMPSAIAS